MEELKGNNMSKECDIPYASYSGKCTSQNCIVLSRNAMMLLYSREWPEESGNIWSRFILKAFFAFLTKAHIHKVVSFSN